MERTDPFLLVDGHHLFYRTSNALGPPWEQTMMGLTKRQSRAPGTIEQYRLGMVARDGQIGAVDPRRDRMDHACPPAAPHG